MSNINNLPRKPVIFTDLDACLLNHHDYSYQAAEKNLNALKKHFPVIINSSKTFNEIVDLCQELCLQAPFIFENGSAIALPPDYLPEPPENHQSLQGWYILSLSRPRQEILDALYPLHQQFKFTGFYDMSCEQLMQLTGLNHIASIKAKARLFTEPLYWQDGPEKLPDFRQSLQQQGIITLEGGRFLHCMDNVDKGSAMLHLLTLFQKAFQGEYTVIALGDSSNDRKMLEQADYACIIKRPDGTHLAINPHSHLILTEKQGSSGWNEAIIKLQQQHIL